LGVSEGGSGAAPADYVTAGELLSGVPAIPQRIDSTTFEYRGIRCNVFGVLHGLTGGTNQ